MLVHFHRPDECGFKPEQPQGILGMAKRPQGTKPRPTRWCLSWGHWTVPTDKLISQQMLLASHEDQEAVGPAADPAQRRLSQ